MTATSPLGEPTSEIQYQAGATDAYPTLAALTDDDDDNMPTLAGDSPLLAEEIRLGGSPQLASSPPHAASTDEIPVAQIPAAARGADPDASAELISDEEVEEVVDDEELIDE
jgi:hypothetical protein